MAERPKRIQRKRTKGWRMPPNAVYVGRPSKWGNPWQKVSAFGDCPEAITSRFRGWIEGRVVTYGQLYCGHAALTVEEIQAELRGKDLCCWCPLDEPCHADVLLELANPEGA